MKKKNLVVIVLIALVLLTAITVTGCKKNRLPDFCLIVPEKWQMQVGDSRSVDYAFNINIKNRKLTWSVFPKSLASVDEWGRVTAKKPGYAWIKAKTSDGLKDTVRLKIVKRFKDMGTRPRIVDYKLSAVSLNSTYQKLVTYYEIGNSGIPQEISGITDYENYQTVTTADGAQWTITEYGVLRTDPNAVNSRDAQQRFMGDRYFYSNNGKLKAIVPDGGNGIWTIMDEGVTHIQMVQMSGKEKAILMSDNTLQYVSRRGMVSDAVLTDGEWKPKETDNDGLWTSMYGAGELMRYASLKKSSSATPQEIEAAKRSATLATEAVLLLANICMRKGEVEAYVRYQPNAMYDDANGRYLSEVALEKGGDYSLKLPNCSPAAAFEYAYEQYLQHGVRTYFLTEDYMYPFVGDDWSDPRQGEGEYAKRVRNLEGYVARTYSFREENNPIDGFIYWSFNGDGTATGVSTREEGSLGYYINGENLREVTVDASGEIPSRLWDSLIGEGYSVEDIVYKGDTSSDEIIGHLFLYKLAFDILGPEDKELRKIIANTMDRLAKHIVDNGYMMVDGSGQPGTWSKFNREFFYNSSQLGGAPLTAAVALSLFKLAHYVTGNQRWHDEYRMAALHPSYEYAKIMTQYHKQCHFLMMLTLDEQLGPQVREMFGSAFEYGSPTSETLIRLFLNYSDEEMAMLAFYLLFQMEDDEELLNYYRQAIDQWWISIKYSENPLWYYIYQLAYPDKLITDAYGNNILETAAWSLSRHPIDLRKLSASSTARDDIAEFSLRGIGINDSAVLSYEIENGEKFKFSGNLITDMMKVIASGHKLKWAVAAPDERALHKYNGPTYELHGHYYPNVMEGSTTYTLPFWMGIYHGMLTE